MSNKEDKYSEFKKKLEVFLEKVGTLTLLQRLGICLVTFVIIVGGYYWFIFKQKQENLDRARQIYKTQEQTLTTYKKKAAQLPKYEKEMAMAQEKFNQAMQQLPDKKELPNLLTQISKAGANSGLIFHLFKPGNTVTKEYYNELPVSIKVEGHYHQLTDFFYQVTKINRIVNINNVEVRSGKNNDPLQMSCQAVTYMFVEKKEVDNTARKRKKK